MSRKANKRQWRIKKAMEHSIFVSIKLSDLWSSYTVKQEARVHPLGELKGLGIGVIQWDGG